MLTDKQYQQIPIIQKNILSWYNENKRNFPRRNTTDPYAIHICEVMSQQTQMDRVLPYWKQWMQDIPDYHTLANISKLELLSHRSGLGFNSRALRLQQCAKIVVEQYNGVLPQDREILLTLPGIGPYTAGAICAFARNQDVAVIDTNIRRIFIFLLGLPEDVSQTELEEVAQEILPKGQSRDWYNALMDYGASHLTARKTKIKSKGKQSTFEGSNRQVRGRILKQLMKNNALEISVIKEEFPSKDIDTIITQMQTENLITRQDTTISV